MAGRRAAYLDARQGAPSNVGKVAFGSIGTLGQEAAMKASDVMTTAVVTVRPEAAVADVARLMLDRHISGVPVVDDRERLVGIVTEGDLMRRAELTAGGEPWWQSLAASPEQKARAYVKGHGTTVRDVMTTDVVTIDENDPLDRIAMVFEGRGI
jgi:CBS domain-containing protein